MCTEVQNPPFGCSSPLMGASSLHTSTDGHQWPHFAGLSLWYVWSGGLVHSMAWVPFWSLAWGTTPYSFDSLLQGGRFRSRESAGTVALLHPKPIAYFCICIPHIIHHPEMALSVPSFPDHTLPNCLWSSVSYFNSVSQWALWPRSISFLGTQSSCTNPSCERRAKALNMLLFISFVKLDGQVQVRYSLLCSILF